MDKTCIQRYGSYVSSQISKQNIRKKHVYKDMVPMYLHNIKQNIRIEHVYKDMVPMFLHKYQNRI